MATVPEFTYVLDWNPICKSMSVRPCVDRRRKVGHCECSTALQRYRSSVIICAVSTSLIYHVIGLALDGEEVTRETFPLPVLGKRLENAALELHQGRGFIVLRGLNPQNYNEEDNVLAFTGVSSYIAEKKGMQDDAGSIFGDFASRFG
jgi:hypothetical protein